MNGAIIINKPAGMTSRDVVNHLNRILETREIGHTGTLDPLATGVLVCLIGRATKLSNILTAHDKEYIASFKLGLLTDTLDITGEVLKEEKALIDKKQIIKVLNKFVGEYEQEVPLYSAVKVKGKKLYDYARGGEKVDLPKRKVQIKLIKLLKIEDDIITVRTEVSKGTYIRSLVRDIGESLGTYGTLVSLERTISGHFRIEDANTIEDVLNNQYHLLTINEILKAYPQEELDPEALFRVRNGQILGRSIDNYLLFTFNQEPIALYQRYDKDENKIKPAVMFYIYEYDK